MKKKLERNQRHGEEKMLEINLHDNKLSTNLHARKRRSDLLRPTCKIVDKAYSSLCPLDGRSGTRPHQPATLDATRSRQRATALPRTYRYIVMVTTTILLYL